MVDHQGVLTYTNPALSDLLRVPHGSLTGAPAVELVRTHLHPDEQGEVLAGLKSWLEGGESPLRERRLIDGEGDVRWVHLTTSRLPDRSCQGAALLVTVRDIDAIKQAELTHRVREDELALVREALEARVVVRTRELQAANNDLIRNAAVQRVLGQLLAQVQGSATVEDYVEGVLDLVTSFTWLPWQGVAGFFVWDEPSQVLRLISTRGMEPERLCPAGRISIGSCVCGRAAQQRDILHLDSTDPRHELGNPEVHEHGHYSVPILRGDRLLGVMMLHIEPQHRPEPWEEDFLRTVADTVGLGLESLNGELERRKLAMAVEQSDDWIVITDPHGAISYVNAAVCRLSGYTGEELIGRTPALFQSGTHDASFYRTLWSDLQQGGGWRGILENRAKDGSLFQLDATIQPLLGPDGGISHFVSTGRDVTKLRAYEDRLLRMAHYDTLTELPNRSLFAERLSHACTHVARGTGMVAVAVMDIDRFKMLNDGLGYAGGDNILQELASRLRAVVREGDTVARLGTDEFGVALVGIDRAEDVGLVVRQRLMGALHDPFHVGDQQAVVTASVGIAICSDGASDVHKLLADAYAALDRAKQLGGNGFVFHQPSMNDRVTEFVQTQRRLAEALELDQYVLHYQPYVELAQGQAAGMEALLRWQPPGQALVPPGRFIPILEETGMIRQVGAWVIREAARQIGAWLRSGVAVVPVSVNLSPIQFREPGLVALIDRAVADAGIPAKLLNLEITESTFMADIEHSREVLRQLRERGHAVLVDDFGTGHSSLAYLRTLPVDLLKIDMSFVRELPTDSGSVALINAIIQMAHGLGLRTVAEGVETHKQNETLRHLRCDLAQGWHHARPMPAARVATLLGAAADRTRS